MTPISLRSVQAADRDFLQQLYGSVRAAELEMVPWTPEQKRAFVEMQFNAQLASYAERYPAASHDIILRGGIPAGRVYLSREPDRLHILDITVAAEQRNQGIGSALLASLVQEADSTARPVSIYIEDFNPSRSLFERFGFGIASRDGYQLLLVRPPATPSVAE